jgi:hypothetical protein
MNSLAYELHYFLNKKERFKFPFDKSKLPKNGIYILFEKGECFGEMDRIVRVGTHTGDNQLPSRLMQHFVKENKNRSIFRKNIGRCFLNMDNKDYLVPWELNITQIEGREDKLKRIDHEFEKKLEKRITQYIQKNLSFCVFEVDTKDKRLFWESKITSTLSNAVKSGEIKPSYNWLGNKSTKEKIRESGLWQVNELYKENLTVAEFEKLVTILK